PSRIEHWTGDRHTAYGIGPIEHDELLSVLSADLHRLAHGRYIGIEARADVLNVEQDRIDVGQHRRCRPPRLAVEAKHLQSRSCVLCIADLRDVELAFKAVLGAEEHL